VGGDYYDFHLFLDGTLTVVIGDATGHGMKAGTVVTITKSLFNNLSSHGNILEVFSRISRFIKSMNFRQLAMCLIMLKIKGNCLRLSSAAMPPALIYRKKNRKVEKITLNGMPLGTMNKSPYTLKETVLNEGDCILLLSDGLPELFNDSKEMYGYDRTRETFAAVAEEPPGQILAHLKNAAAEWSGGNPPDDDISFVVIKSERT